MYLRGCTGSLNPVLAHYGRTNECTRANTVLPPISEVSTVAVSLVCKSRQVHISLYPCLREAMYFFLSKTLTMAEMGEVSRTIGYCQKNRIFLTAFDLKLAAMSRHFAVCLPDGTEQGVVQLQTENWPDLTAPDDPR